MQRRRSCLIPVTPPCSPVIENNVIYISGYVGLAQRSPWMPPLVSQGCYFFFFALVRFFLPDKSSIPHFTCSCSRCTFSQHNTPLPLHFPHAHPLHVPCNPTTGSGSLSRHVRRVAAARKDVGLRPRDLLRIATSARNERGKG